MNFLYFQVVSGDTFFFFFFSFALEPKFLFLVVGNCLQPPDLKENCGLELCLNTFLENLSIISLLVWQVQKPGAGLNSAERECI